MKQGIKKTSSYELLQASLKRSLKIININPDRCAHYETAKNLRLGNLSETTLKKLPRTNRSSISSERKPTGLPTPEDSQKVTIEKILRAQLESKRKEVEEKERMVQEKEIFLKQLELGVKKKEKELGKKEREFRIRSAGCKRMVAEGIAKGIIEELVWECMFRNAKREAISVGSRKQACLTALTKMKRIVDVLEELKRDLEKQALILISQRQSIPLKPFKS